MIESTTSGRCRRIAAHSTERELDALFEQSVGQTQELHILDADHPTAAICSARRAGPDLGGSHRGDARLAVGHEDIGDRLP